MAGSVFSRVFAGTISVGFARLSLIVFGLITVIIAVRYISPEEYGAFVLLQVILTFLTEFTGFGLSLAVPRSLAASDEPLFKRRIINTAIWFRVLTAILTSFLILVLRIGLDRYIGPSKWSDWLLYLLVLLGLTCLENTFEWILQGLFLFNLIGLLGTIGILLNLVLTLVFIVYLKLGILGLVYAKLIPIAVQLLIAGVYSKIEYRLEFNRGILKEMLVFGFPLQLQYTLDFSFSRIDTLIIASLLGTSGTAYYEVARKIPDSLTQLFNAFRSVYFPMVTELNASHQYEKASNLLNTSIRGLSFIALLGAMISVAFGKDIILLLFASQYLLIYPVFVVRMVGLSLNILENTLGYSLVAIGEPYKPLIVNIARASISAVGNLLVIPVIGIMGAALVYLSGNIIATPLDIFFLSRKKFFVRTREYLKPLIIFVASTAAFYSFTSPSYFVKLGVMVLFMMSCFFLSVIKKEDFLAISGETRAMVSRLARKH